MHFMSRVFSNTTSLMTSVCMLYVGVMAARSYLSLYADKLLKGENQSMSRVPVFPNTTSLMTSVCMLYVGAMAASSYLTS